MHITVDVITRQKEIYAALVESEDKQSIIGIASSDLGSGIHLTTVKEVTSDGTDVIIVLNSYDTTGYFLEKNKVSLNSITGVVPFKAVFVNPFLRELQQKDETERKRDGTPDYLF